MWVFFSLFFVLCSSWASAMDRPNDIETDCAPCPRMTPTIFPKETPGTSAVPLGPQAMEQSKWHFLLNTKAADAVCPAGFLGVASIDDVVSKLPQTTQKLTIRIKDTAGKQVGSFGNRSAKELVEKLGKGFLSLKKVDVSHTNLRNVTVFQSLLERENFQSLVVIDTKVTSPDVQELGSPFAEKVVRFDTEESFKQASKRRLCTTGELAACELYFQNKS